MEVTTVFKNIFMPDSFPQIHPFMLPLNHLEGIHFTAKKLLTLNKKAIRLTRRDET